jgi:hypothetical protein
MGAVIVPFRHRSFASMMRETEDVFTNYHAQFASILRNASYPVLVKKMQEKTLVVKTFEAVPTQ